MKKYKKLHQYSISNKVKSNSHLQNQTQSHQKQNLPKFTGLKNPTVKQNTEANSKIFLSSNFISKPYFNKQQLNPSNKAHNFKEDTKKDFFANIFKLKIGKLSTSITYLQKQRYLRKLAQTIQQETFRAVGFQFDVEFVKQICLFCISSQISKLVLDKNPLGDEGILRLSGFLPKMSICQLSLVSVGLTNKGAKYLFSSLTGNSNLKAMNISSVEGILKNKVTSEGAQYIRRLLSHQQCAIHTMYLDNISLGTAGTKSTFDLNSYAPLRSLTLSKNQIGCKNTQCIFGKIGCLPLAYLDISKNNIMDSGIKSISHVLGHLYGRNSASANLIHLNLSSNNISSLGLQVFCHEVSQNQTLQTLILDENPLSGQGFASIKNFLIKNWGLRRLSLANICPLQRDLKYVCEGLQLNRSLQWLNLSKNEIIGQVFSSILLMLVKNKSLRQIQLNSCMLSDVQILPNYNLINTSAFTCIQQIQLENNFINTKGCDFFKRMIALNPNIWRLSLKKNCATEKVISQIKRLLSDNKNKIPSQLELNHYKTVADLYEQKRRDLQSKVFIMQIQEDNLRRNLLTDQIGHQEINKQKILREIQQERSIIQKLVRQRSLEVEESEFEEDIFFSTQACSS